MFFPVFVPTPEGGLCVRANVLIFCRSMDAIGAGVRDSQVFHLCEGAAHGRYIAQGGEDVEGLGVEYWQGTVEEGRHWYSFRQRQRNGRQYEGRESKGR